MKTRTYSVRGLALAAALTVGAVACSSSNDPSFKPGHYVAGAMVGLNEGSTSAPEFSFLDYGLLDLDVADDGDITGSFQIYNSEFSLPPDSMPDFNVVDFDVTGTASGLTFDLDIDMTPDYTIHFEGTGDISDDGQLGGVFQSNEGNTGYLLAVAGVETGTTETSIACGSMGFSISGETKDGAPGMFLMNEGKLYGAFVGQQFAGGLETTLTLDPEDTTCMGSITGCGTGSGTIELTGENADTTFDGTSFHVEFDAGAFAPEDYLYVEGGSLETETDYYVGFGGSTNGCYSGGG